MPHFIPEPSNFFEFNRLPAEAKKAWLKSTLKGIKNIISNQNFLMGDPKKGDKVTPRMDVYEEKKQSNGGLDNLRFIFIVRGAGITNPTETLKPNNIFKGIHDIIP